MNITYPLKNLVISCWICMSLCSCEKFLDKKPSSRLNIPTTLADCQALLDDYGKMNQGYPADGQASDDDYYLNDADWNALPSLDDRDTYRWVAGAQHANVSWLNPYSAIYNANLVLSVLDDSAPEPREKDYHDELRGAALFFRAQAHFQIAQLYAAPFSEESADRDQGIPIRLSLDLDQLSRRGTVRQTYDHITQDLTVATSLLPTSSILASRPDKAAAHGMLARVFLSMQKYDQAGTHASQCLDYKSELMDFNDLDSLAALPISRFNPEVIFQSLMYPSSLLSGYLIKVDSTLYQSYAENDLRRPVFFIENGDGSAGFKGNYDGDAYSGLFNGLATDEVYLILAECKARAGLREEAMDVLNTLLQTRWKKDHFTPFTAGTDDAALRLVLQERRKELVFRGQRWTDLRRLNQDPAFALTLTRRLNGELITLPPNDLRYVLLIPQDVINNSSIPQNLR